MNLWNPAVDVNPTLGTAGRKIDGCLISRRSGMEGRWYMLPAGNNPKGGYIVTLTDLGSIASILGLALTIAGIVYKLLRKKK